MSELYHVVLVRVKGGSVVIVSETGVTIRYHAPYDVLFQPSVVPVPRWGKGFR